MKVSMREVARCLALACVVLQARPGLALDWGMQARVSAIDSDNLAQAPKGLEESATIGVVELGAELEHSTKYLLLDAEASHAYRHFFQSAFDDENRSQLRASFSWMPVRDVLRLSVTETYGQLALNPAEGLLPSNYENANVVTAGPTAMIPLGPDTRIVAEGEYRAASFSESPVDTSRRFGQLSIERELSRVFTAHAGVSAARVDFDIDGLSRGYDVKSVDAGVDAVGRRTSLGLQAGRDTVDFGGDRFTGSSYQLNVERRLTRATRLFATARQEITDSAQVFQLGQVTDPAMSSIRDVQLTSQPMQRTQYRLGWVWAGARASLNLQGGFINERFDVLLPDPLLAPGVNRIVREYGLDTRYRLRGGSTLGASVQVLRESFQGGLRSNDLFATVSYTRQFSDKLGLELRAQRIERTESPRDFRELRLFAFLTYALRDLREPRAAVFDRQFERRIQRERSPARAASPAGDDAE
ncbi:MAG: hypothetical protein ABIP38_01560 [Steroidobacteraceae bacterium]